jgi:hypothetical protein
MKNNSIQFFIINVLHQQPEGQLLLLLLLLSVVWSSITTTDANKLECIQQKFAALCYNRFLPHVHYSYAKALEYLKLHTLRQ